MWLQGMIETRIGDGDGDPKGVFIIAVIIVSVQYGKVCSREASVHPEMQEIGWRVPNPGLASDLPSSALGRKQSYTNKVDGVIANIFSLS